jgi:hypothetical protein
VQCAEFQVGEVQSGCEQTPRRRRGRSQRGQDARVHVVSDCRVGRYPRGYSIFPGYVVFSIYIALKIRGFNNDFSISALLRSAQVTAASTTRSCPAPQLRPPAREAADSGAHQRAAQHGARHPRSEHTRRLPHLRAPVSTLPTARVRTEPRTVRMHNLGAGDDLRRDA